MPGKEKKMMSPFQLKYLMNMRGLLPKRRRDSVLNAAGWSLMSGGNAISAALSHELGENRQVGRKDFAC
jgi:hypothetical protein